MRALLLPIKDHRNAKQRLAGILTPEERQALAHAMMIDVLNAVKSVRRAERIFVVTNFEPAMRIAESAGWTVLAEGQQISESASVDAASHLCAGQGVTALLRVPLDLPLIQPEDIDELLSLDFVAPATILVPSRGGTGTNAILRAPPALFPSQFGTGSFAKHRALAEAAGAQILVHSNPRLAMDVDDLDDLLALLRQDLSATAIGKWLAGSDAEKRLAGFKLRSNSADN